MTDKKTKNKQNAEAMAQEDIQLYRLFMIFGAAILGFAGLRLIPDYVFSRVLGIGQWIALALLVIATAGYIYIRCIKKVDESGKLITSTGVAYFLLPVLFMLATYRSFDKANFKFQLFFALLSIFAVIYNIYKREFKNITALTFICAIGLYYAAHPVYSVAYSWIEIAVAALSEALMIAFPIFAIVLLICAMMNKKGVVRFKGHTVYALPSKFGGILAFVMSSVLLLAAAILMIVPAIFTYVMISVLVCYVIVGIVCTIRLI
ncbi:MAG: hypothetical protein IJ489_00710 [Clostridia bacterium]|nr:hypothetical protein [Clostridia bacterium]